MSKLNHFGFRVLGFRENLYNCLMLHNLLISWWISEFDIPTCTWHLACELLAEPGRKHSVLQFPCILQDVCPWRLEGGRGPWGGSVGGVREEMEYRGGGYRNGGGVPTGVRLLSPVGKCPETSTRRIISPLIIVFSPSGVVSTIFSGPFCLT